MATETTVKMRFDPEVLDRSKVGEVNMTIDFSLPDTKKAYWCECVVQVKAPLSLSPDAALEKGRTMVGILSPDRRSIIKQVKLFSVPSMTNIDYLVTVTTYLYDDEATIAERHDTSEVIKVGIPNIKA